MSSASATLRRTTSCLAIALAILSGCGEHETAMRRRVVAIDKVPAPLMAVAKKELPGVDFQEAWTNLAGTEGEAIHSYEIRGRTSSNKVREIRVAPDGKVLEME